MSKIEVNQVDPQSGTTLTLGTSGDTISIPAGVTLSNSGTATGFASITWQSVQTTGFTAVAGNAYPCNTTSAGFTVTLPATPSAGDQVQLVDYAGTFDTNALVINPNGEDIEGGTDNLQLSGEREGVILTYIDSTQGWIATSGINEGTDALAPVPYSAEYLVVAGGGGGGSDLLSGGGGAGGLLNGSTTFLPSTSHTVTVGAGGASAQSGVSAVSGSDSTLQTASSTITSFGGGRAATYTIQDQPAGDGGSGGGGDLATDSGGSGTVGQGNDGGYGQNAASGETGGGGGGAGAAGSNGIAQSQAGNGGVGLDFTTWSTATSTGDSGYYAGGGGGAINGNYGQGIGGTGGGGNGKTSTTTNEAGAANTGGGGGGGSSPYIGNGGSGIIIIRYSGSQKGTGGTVTSSGGYTYHTFTSTGTYTG
jgi:hypothetical protein